MAFEARDLSGVLFKNQKKSKDTHPDYTGNCKIGPKEYWVSSWIKEGKNGKFLSLAFQERDIKIRAPDHTEPKRSSREEMDDEVPF